MYRVPATRKKTWFPVGEDLHDNVLLKPFVTGVTQKEIKDDYAADQFSELLPVGIDQLLMIRMAQRLRRAPGKIKGKEPMISNQRPIATTAANCFSEDLRKYVRSYATEVPRQAFVEALESCVAIGLTTITSSAIEIRAGMGPIRVTFRMRGVSNPHRCLPTVRWVPTRR